jgi:hypothetical protein
MSAIGPFVLGSIIDEAHKRLLKFFPNPLFLMTGGPEMPATTGIDPRPKELCQMSLPQSEFPEKATTPDEPWLQVLSSRDFPAWLAEQRLSLAFSTYQAGKLLFLGLQPDGSMAVFERTFNRCMGLYGNGQTLWLSSTFQLWRFENALAPGEVRPMALGFQTDEIHRLLNVGQTGGL